MTDDILPQPDNIHNCGVDDLSAMLFEVFQDPNVEDAEVVHPTEGKIIVTRQEYFAHLNRMERAKSMSPADRIVENKRLKNIKKRKQADFVESMKAAPVHTVDIEDDTSFGKDVDGNDLSIEGMVFVPIVQYLPGIEVIEREIGCFIFEHDDDMAPVRILQQTPPGGFVDE